MQDQENSADAAGAPDGTPTPRGGSIKDMFVNGAAAIETHR